MRLTKLTDEQTNEALEAVQKHGSVTAAAEALGLKRTTMSFRYNTAIQRNAAAGIEAPFVVKGTSTYFNGNGKMQGQWVKTKTDEAERWRMIQEAIEARVQEIVPRKPVTTKFEEMPSAELLNLLTLTDCHVGAMCWHREGGDDWDLKIAQECLTRIFVGMIKAMPPAKLMIVNNLGDFLHTDGLKALTPGNAHLLDADGRFPKLSEVAVQILEDIITAALERHEQVHFINAEGNHDEASSSWLRLMFKRIYRDEPRVTVEDSPLPFYAFEHGEVMLAFHHGHKLAPPQLPLFFASRFPQIWGRTKRRYGHSGHRHHLDEKDYSGMRWLQHPTMAANDAYGARAGYISPREAIAITYDFKKERNRIFATPEMFDDAAPGCAL